MRIEVIFFIVMVVLSIIDAMKRKRARQEGHYEIDPQTGEVLGPREAPTAVARAGAREDAPPTTRLPMQQREGEPAGVQRGPGRAPGVTLEDMLRGLAGVPTEAPEPEPKPAEPEADAPWKLRGETPVEAYPRPTVALPAEDSARKAHPLETSRVPESEPADEWAPASVRPRKETTWWNKDDDLHPYQLAKRRSDPFAFLRGRDGMRRAVISQEILGPPLSLRKE